MDSLPPSTRITLSLESLYFVMDLMFYSLQTALQQLEVKHTRTHPWKCLVLKGFFKRPVKVLSGLLSLESVFMSELTLESMSHDARLQGEKEDPYGLTTPWPYSQDSLTSLDLHSLNSPAPEVIVSLFRRVQKLKQLKSLLFRFGIAGSWRVL